MEPIQPANVRTTGAYPTGTPNIVGGSNRTNSGSAAAPRPIGTTGASATDNIANAATQLLRAVGGGAENDQVLRALVTLLIVLALLNETLSATRSPASDLSSLSRGVQSLAAGGGSSAFMIQHTSVTMASTTIVGTFGAGDTAQPEAGGRLDVNA